jgi:hypothetical protein
MKEVVLLKGERRLCPFLEKLLHWFNVPARLPLQLCNHLTLTFQPGNLCRNIAV